MQDDSNMSITINPEVNEHYKTIYLGGIFKDPRTDWREKGLHTYLISRPPGWKLWMKDLLNQVPSGRDNLYSSLKVLEDNGYLERVAIRNKKGKVVRWQYNIFHKPLPVKPEVDESTLTHRHSSNFIEHPLPASPDLANPHHRNKDIKNKGFIVFPSEKQCAKKFSRKCFPKIVFSDNGNKDSSVDEQSPLQLLGDWLDYDIPVLPYNKPVINLRTKLFEKKIKPSALLVKSILDYWNEMATALKLNGWKVPLHYIKDNKTTFMCQLIVTGLSKINGYTEKQIKNAIDNHAIIMDNSNWYRKTNGQKPYNFIQFFSNQKLFEDCITDNVKGNSRYFNVKGGNGTRLATIMEKYIKNYSKANYGREPEGEERKYITQEAWNEYDKILANRGIPAPKRKIMLNEEWKEINHAR